MNQEIWKFCTTDRGFVGRFELKMPKNAQLLYVDIDANNFPCIWALVYPHEENETRYFELYGTGQSIPNDMGVVREYVGSYRYQKGEFIGHIFERIK